MLFSRDRVVGLASKFAQVFDTPFKVYSPDINTELLNNDGQSPFIAIVNVPSEILAVDPNWQATETLYKIELATSDRPNSQASYFIERNGQKEQVTFVKDEERHHGFVVYLRGN